MTPRESAIVLLFICAFAVALAVWGWRMTSVTYPRNDRAPSDVTMRPEE